MPEREPWVLSTEATERSALLRKYEEQEPILGQVPISEMEPEAPLANTDFKDASTAKAIEEATYFEQGNGDHPNMRVASKQKHKMPTPDEAEEQGIMGKFVDEISDFSLGVATGVGYGIDEMAVSASQLMNTMIPDSIMGDADEYTGRYIGKYMDTVSKRFGLEGDGGADAGRAIGQFIIGWIPALRAVKLLSKAQGLSKLGKGIPANVLASTLAGGTAYAPDHQNLGNDLAKIDNHLAGAVSRAIATNPNDPDWKNRLRNALQEGGLAVVGDKILLPLIKGAGKATGAAVKPVHEWFIDALDLHKQAAAVKTITKSGTVESKSVKVLVTDEKGMVQAVDPQATAIEAKAGIDSLGVGAQTSKATVKFTIKDDQTIAQAIGDGKAIEENMLGMSTMSERLDYATSLSEQIGQASPKGTKVEWSDKGFKLAIRAGLDVDTMKMIHKEGVISPEIMYGFGHVAQSVTAKLEQAIELSKTVTGKLNVSKEEVLEAGANFARSLADSIEIQQMLRDAKTTAGQSLRAAATVVDDLGKNFNKSRLESADAQQVIDFFKTSKLGGMELPRIVDMLYEAHIQGGRPGLNKVLKEGFKSGEMSMFIEAWINQGLLSNPATHVMNMVIGGANLVSQPISQLTAATISKIPFANKILGTDTVTYREAFGSMYGMLAGLTKAFRLSMKAGVSGESSWGGASKIDNYGMQHIAAKTLDMEGTAIGLGLDYMGSLTRSSGRFLLMEDEFVKTVAGEMKKHSLAMRYAYSNYGKSKGVKQLYKEIVDNPHLYKERIGNVDYSFENQIQEFADLVTFQKKTGKIATYLTQAGIQYPLLKLGMPFVKVLANIPKYTVQHSPLGLAFQNQDFKKGGTARMLELGRMSYGTMLMWYGAQMYQTGQLTGSGPREYWKAINSQQTGAEPPRSIKIKPAYAKANQAYWIDISRFSPYSNLLMMGADISQAMDAREDLEPTELIGKALTSIQKNLVDPTWAPSLHKVLGLAADSSSEPGDWTRAIKSITGTMQPSFVRAYEKVKSPGKAELKTYDLNPESIGDFQPADWSGYMAQILATSSAHSDLVPTTRNILGDQVKHENGTDSGLPGVLHNPVWSFLTIRKADESPAIVHLFKDLEIEVPRPNHILTINNKIPVRLTPHEYEEYVKRIGKMKDNSGQNMKSALTNMFNSSVYQKVYKEWKNSTGEQSKPHLKKQMAGFMTKVYNDRKTMARASIIYDFELVKRSHEVWEKFGGIEQ